jgi:hypothetical protein
MKHLFPHLHSERPTDAGERAWSKYPPRKLESYRAIPYRLVLSSSSRSAGSAFDAVFHIPPQAWGLDPMMDLSKTKFQLRVESFAWMATKINPADDDIGYSAVLNIDGIGNNAYSWDSANRASTSACAVLSGTQDFLNDSSRWDIPLSVFTGSMRVRVWLSDLNTPRAPTALPTLVNNCAWHAVLALTPCDSDINA